MSSSVTNLGNHAQADVLIANTQMRCPSFSQPEQSVGSPTTPSTTITQAYVAGINKYIFYYPLYSGGGPIVDNDYSITSMPANFMNTHSSSSSIVAIATTSFSTHPTFSAIHLYYNEGTNTFYSNPRETTRPVFSTGTAYMKVVTTFTVD